jgi:hypothetical protein
MSTTADTYIAIPSGDHCLSGNLHTGETRGKIEIIEEAPTYITTPKSGKGNGNIIFYFPDVHGFYNNAMLLMDAFADAGYTVFGIDYFRDASYTSPLDAKAYTIPPPSDSNMNKKNHRTQSGSTAKTRTTKQPTRPSTTSPGAPSTSPSPKQPYPDGRVPSPRDLEPPPRNTPASATASALPTCSPP